MIDITKRMLKWIAKRRQKGDSTEIVFLKGEPDCSQCPVKKRFSEKR